MILERLDLDGFERAAQQWESLADGSGSPFSTADWLAAWWRVFAPEEGLALVLRDGGGALVAGGCFVERSRGHLAAATNAHTNDWGIVARDASTAELFWQKVGGAGWRQVELDLLLDQHGAVAAPRDALAESGFRPVQQNLPASPWLELPESLEALLAERSRNLRSQVSRRRRALQREGELSLRIVTGGETLDSDLDAFFALEAAGWKGKEGTAIALDPALVEMYREFAHRAADRGWLRLYMLELDNRLVAADYGLAFQGCGYLVKTAFDEEMGRLAPGLVLRAEVLGSSIEEGLSRYDFLGGPDGYKMRWADRLQDRAALRAFRGVAGVPPYLWWKAVRPALKRVKDRF